MSVAAIIFDISGTVLDFGSRGPVLAFVEAFRSAGIEITEAEARGPMGAAKRDHIARVLAAKQIAATEADIDALYAKFIPLQIEVLKDHCGVLPGVLDLVTELRRRGLKLANTTGFAREMMHELIPRAEAGGYRPDLWLCPDDVDRIGRPAPWMIFQAARAFNVYPMSRIVKVGDTVADIEEAHAAGVWCVSVIDHGNEVGLSEEAFHALSPEQREQATNAARTRLAAHHPHFILDRTANLLPVLDEINCRLAEGHRP
jgi:phosphonoacetaldehyde hydrolase